MSADESREQFWNTLRSQKAASCLLRHGVPRLFRTDPHSRFINKRNPWSSITWGNAPSGTLHLKSPSSHLVGNFSTKGFRLLFIQSQSRVSQNHFCFNTTAEFSSRPRLSPNCFISSRRYFLRILQLYSNCGLNENQNDMQTRKLQHIVHVVNDIFSPQSQPVKP